jgi:hypothetical protein
MTSNRTVPTPIVNKNGVSTTVHKRVDNPLGASRTNLPSPPTPLPKAAPAKHGGMTMDQLNESPSSMAFTLRNEMDRNRHRLSANVRAKALRTLHPETLDKLQDNVRTVINVFTRAMDSSLKARNFGLLNNMAVLFDQCDEVTYNSFDRFVTGLERSGDLKSAGFKDYSEATEEELKPVRAVLRASIVLPHPYSGRVIGYNMESTGIGSDRLVDLIESRPDDVDYIIQLLQERKLPVDSEEDIAAVTGLLDNSQPALRDGLL